MFISHRRLRRAFTNGVLDAHQTGNAWRRYSTDAQQWAYEAGYREGEKVVQKNVTLRKLQERTVVPSHYSMVTHPPLTPRPRDPTTPNPGVSEKRPRDHVTNQPVPRRPDPFVPERVDKEWMRDH